MLEFDRLEFEQLICRLWAERRGVVAENPSGNDHAHSPEQEHDLLREGLTRAMVDGLTFDRLFEIYLRGLGPSDDAQPPTEERRRVLERGFGVIPGDRVVEWATHPAWVAQLWDDLDSPSQYWVDVFERLHPLPRVTHLPPMPKPPRRFPPTRPLAWLLWTAATILFVGSVAWWTGAFTGNGREGRNPLSTQAAATLTRVPSQKHMGPDQDKFTETFRVRLTSQHSGCAVTLHDAAGKSHRVAPAGYLDKEDEQPVRAGEPILLEQLFESNTKHPARLLTLVTDKPAAEVLTQAARKGRFPPIEPEREKQLLATIDEVLAERRIRRVDHAFSFDSKP